MNHQHYHVYFHLGMTKVASTYLQTAIFPYLENIRFHPKHHFRTYKKLSKKTLDKHHLFSTEKDRRLVELVDEILAFFPEARIIIIVRRHDQWLLSKYKYYIRKHGYVSFREFFDLESDKGLWKRSDLFLQSKIEAIEKKCTTKPLVLTHDMLRSSPDQFLDRLASYMNSSLGRGARKRAFVNRAFSEKQLIFLRRFNSCYPYREKKSSSKFRNRVHYKYREFLLHIVAFFSQFLPATLLNGEKLIDDPGVLEEIRKYYHEDWSFCTTYASENL